MLENFDSARYENIFAFSKEVYSYLISFFFFEKPGERLSNSLIRKSLNLDLYPTKSSVRVNLVGSFNDDKQNECDFREFPMTGASFGR